MWHDPAHNVLVYKARDPRILQYIPAAQMINGEHVMIPVTMTNLQIMRVLAILSFGRSTIMTGRVQSQSRLRSMPRSKLRTFLLSILERVASRIWGQVKHCPRCGQLTRSWPMLHEEENHSVLWWSRPCQRCKRSGRMRFSRTSWGDEKR